MLGGGGLAAVNVYASATEGGWGGGPDQAATGQVRSAGVTTIDCPDVGSRLTSVPDDARADVDRELAALDQQTAADYRQLQASAGQISQDPGAADEPIMNPLKEKRAAAIERIAAAVDRTGDRPEGLESLAACTLRPGQDGAGAGAGDAGQTTAAPATGGRQDGGQGQNGAGQAGAGQGGNGPVVSDYADITAVQPNAPAPPQRDGASRGTFTTECGVNANGLFNSDNVIVAPGVSNGAHHFHDYVGNQSNTAFASDDDLAKADTSCVDKGDRSTYYWPVVRLQNGKQERDAGAPGGGTEGNAGQIVTPKDVTLTFVGSPQGKVTAMPRLLRIITGDAKAFVNGPANANASWSCTGFEDRQLKDKYPLCPAGSDVVRTFRFQSCWDGRNIDSANHRTHVAFATPDGACPAGFQAIPQLVQRIVYDVKAPSLNDGGRTVPLFAVDSFPEQLHKPVTDHGDFINVFDEGLMREMVDCINSGRTCGPGGDSGATAAPSRSPGAGATDEPGGGATAEPGTGATASAEPGPGDTATAEPSSSAPAEEPRTDATTAPANTTKHRKPAEDGRRTEHADGDRRTEAGGGDANSGGAPTTSSGSGGAGKTGRATGTSAAPAADGGGQPTAAQPTAAQSPAVQSEAPVVQPEPQAAGRGGLAETGADLWPAGIGVLLALAGLFMLLRAKRLTH
ncbi:DUF1996 domain-containing protein [Streptomyces sp. ATE26]|uniref:DUF1996 domain-containing protein n=1 Tax=Streptomyces sp. ATE26 TaxID=2954237 RepID=UPI002482F817|nr:DUF1996 domain-containing protein [Streptomyces sp. ATE26]MDI1458092.1 DUF1996 domain-containing protein [Streptomyces sp. ATE26]